MLSKLNTEEFKRNWTAAHPPQAELRDATEEEHENQLLPEPDESFTDLEIETLFPKRALGFAGWHLTAKREEAYNRIRATLKRLRVWPLRAYGLVKNRKVHRFVPAADYPVFLIDEGKLKVIFQPLHPEPELRYQHFGERHTHFVHGLEQAKAEMKKREKEQAEASVTNDLDDDDDKPAEVRKLEKIDEILLVAEAAEAFAPALFGYFVAWSTHPHQLLQGWDYADLNRQTKKLYQVRTNCERHAATCHENALEQLDLYTVELPRQLVLRKGDQEEVVPVRTLRDFFEYQNDYQFTELLRDALPYRFWEMQPEYAGRGQNRVRIGWKYDIDNVQVYNFLQKMGFHRLPVEGQKAEYIFVHRDHNIIRERSANKVKNFIHQFLKERRLDKDLRNKLYTSTQLNDSSLSNLEETSIDFTSFDSASQYMFFGNCTWEVNAAGLLQHAPGKVQRFVWEKDVIEHPASIAEPAFVIRRQPDKSYDIEVQHANCLFFNYLIQTSRIHWRKELEEELEKLSEAEQAKYLQDNKFNIEGPLLTPEERYEQKQHLINKVFAIGYLMHQHKERSKAWAVVAMDGKINQDGKSHGRSGKSICFNQALPRVLKNVFRISGTNPEKTKDPHIFHGLSKYNQLTVIDDADRALNFRFFFEYITGDQVVNPKQNAPYTVKFEELCKLAWLTNFSFITDSSTEGRILYTVFSDYYHLKSENNDYKENRGPKDDFDKELFDQFDEQEFNHFYNTMARCLQFFISCDGKINPPMNNVTKRNLQREMGQEFENWADVYFSSASGNTNRILVKSEVFQEYMQDKAKGSAKETWFKNALKAYCKFNGYIFNPDEVINEKGKNGKEGRIVHFLPTRTLEPRSGNWITGDKATKECIYIQTDFTNPVNQVKPGEVKSF